jgi:hypothetical protein
MDRVVTSYSDWNRKPAKPQVQTTQIKSGLFRILWQVLSQKGDPTLIKCAYCQKEIQEEKAIESELVYLQGPNVARRIKKYCSTRCASYDQMAHEP